MSHVRHRTRTPEHHESGTGRTYGNLTTGNAGHVLETGHSTAGAEGTDCPAARIASWCDGEQGKPQTAENITESTPAMSSWRMRCSRPAGKFPASRGGRTCSDQSHARSPRDGRGAAQDPLRAGARRCAEHVGTGGAHGLATTSLALAQPGPCAASLTRSQTRPPGTARRQRVTQAHDLAVALFKKPFPPAPTAWPAGIPVIAPLAGRTSPTQRGMASRPNTPGRNGVQASWMPGTRSC